MAVLCSESWVFQNIWERLRPRVTEEFQGEKELGEMLPTQVNRELDPLLLVHH